MLLSVPHVSLTYSADPVDKQAREPCVSRVGWHKNIRIFIGRVITKHSERCQEAFHMVLCAHSSSARKHGGNQKHAGSLLYVAAVLHFRNLQVCNSIGESAFVRCIASSLQCMLRICLRAFDNFRCAWVKWHQIVSAQPLWMHFKFCKKNSEFALRFTGSVLERLRNFA